MSDQPTGSRAESVWMFLLFLRDLLVLPLHVVAFAFTRSRHRRRLRAAMERASQESMR